MHGGPFHSIGKIIMGLRVTINFIGKIGEDDVNVLRMVGRFAKEGATANITERAAPVIGRVMHFEVFLT